VNHTRFPKENHLPDWARRDNKVTKGDRVEQDPHRKDFFFREIANFDQNLSKYYDLVTVRQK